MDFSKLLTRDDCENLLEQRLGDLTKIKLLDFTVKPLSENLEGFMGDHLRLTCEILNDGVPEKIQYFIKKEITLPEGKEVEKTLIDSFKTTVAYNKEALFYKVIKENNADLNINWGPRHYRFDKDASLLILDDISVDGFMLGKLLKYDMEHCKIAIKTLAALHTFSIKCEVEKSNGTTNFSYKKEYPHLFDEALFSHDNDFASKYMLASERCLKLGFEYLPNLTPTQIVDLKEKAEEAIEEFINNFVQPSDKFRSMFCHGDLWHKNIMFKYDGETPIDCNYVDFQELRYLPGTHDVLFLVYLNTTPEFRKKHVHELLEYYYEHFRAELQKLGLNPNKIFDYCEFQECCALYLKFTKLIGVIYNQIHLLGDEYLSEQFKLKSDAFELIMGDREKFLIPALETNYNNYVEKVTPVYDELKEILLHPHIIREDCFEIMRRTLQSDNYTLTGFKVHSNRLKLQILQNGATSELKFFFKSLNGDLNKKEVVVYQVLALNNTLRDSAVEKLIRKVMPECYYAVNTKSIVLEDLEGQGFKKTAAEQLDYKTVDLVIQTLAKLHAAYWIFEHKSASERIHKYYEISDVRTELSKEVIYTNSKAVSSVYDVLLSAANEFLSELTNELTDLKNSESKFLRSLKPSTTHKNVLCHGSLTLEHILFKHCKSGRSPVECRFVDFKETRYLPPAYDLLVFLFTSTSQQFREQHFNQIVESYYNYLAQELQAAHLKTNQLLSFEDFKDSFADVRTASMLQATILSLPKNTYVNKLSLKEKKQSTGKLKEVIPQLVCHFKRD